MNGEQAKIGRGYRDMDRREAGRRVVFVVGLGCRYAYVRNERPPHRRSRILRSRLESSAFSLVGEFGDDPSVWPAWFAEAVQP